MMFEERNLKDSLAKLGANGAEDLFSSLSAAYGHSSRHYHNETHVAQCLRQFEKYRGLTSHPEEVQVAIWFHDAVYDTHRLDNEERSAAWAERFLISEHVAPESIERVSDLIMATKTHEVTTADSAILVDVDLCILGAAPDVFEAYDRAIRLEYHWVPETQYCASRIQALQSFLARDAIYHSEQMRRFHEAQARDNLSRKINELEV